MLNHTVDDALDKTGFIPLDDSPLVLDRTLSVSEVEEVHSYLRDKRSLPEYHVPNNARG